MKYLSLIVKTVLWAVLIYAIAAFGQRQAQRLRALDNSCAVVYPAQH
jgi:hypothetical protein